MFWKMVAGCGVGGYKKTRCHHISQPNVGLMTLSLPYPPELLGLQACATMTLSHIFKYEKKNYVEFLKLGL